MKYILVLTIALLGGPAVADDCVDKFVGDWMVRQNSGVSYVGHHLANGVMTADCPMCGSGTWTCQGNTIFKKAPWISYSGTLSDDGNTITEPYGILTRIGPAPPTVNVNTPTVTTPTTPTVQTPIVTTPATPTVNVTTPAVTTPTTTNVQTPIVSTPGTPTINVSTPTVTTPATPTVNVTTPTVTTPTAPNAQAPTVNTPTVQNQKCADARSRLSQFESGMGQAWVKDQLGKMGCS